MTDRRLAHNPARPAVAGRGPDDLPKCHLRPEWLDALMSAGVADDIVEAAQHACGSCPMQVKCWAENEGEGGCSASRPRPPGSGSTRRSASRAPSVAPNASPSSSAPPRRGAAWTTSSPSLGSRRTRSTRGA